MKQLLHTYRILHKPTLRMILAETCIQLVNASFMMILLIYMAEEGYPDHEGAYYFKFRFLSVLLLALPLGFLIRGRAILPYFRFSALVTPIASLVIVYAIDQHLNGLLLLGQIVWGVGFTCIQVTILPYILRNTPEHQQTNAISLSYSTWSFAGIICGVFIFFMRWLFPEWYSEKWVLYIIIGLSFLANIWVWQNKIPEHQNPSKKEQFSLSKNFDWFVIIKAMIPTSLIAIGAGLTIPFIGLFFYHIHGLNSGQFSFMAALALILVFAAIIVVPLVKQKLGFKKAIPLTQSFAILALILLALTEAYQAFTWALPLAVVCYTLRQPLMNIAAPMTSEFTMQYVGKRNQEVVSALTASIWSGSWFLSAWVFEAFRRIDISYMTIFLITAAWYALGVLAYYLLMVEFDNKQKLKTTIK